MQTYAQWVADMKERGVPTTVYKCPHCLGSIVTAKAPVGKKWDTLSTCPHCDAIHMKFTDGGNAKGALPRGVVPAWVKTQTKAKLADPKNLGMLVWAEETPRCWRVHADGYTVTRKRMLHARKAGHGVHLASEILK